VKQYGLELLGFRLTGPPPLVDVWIPVERGVHAFYGLNGAGKTRTLRAIRDLLAGVSGDEELTRESGAYWSYPSHVVARVVESERHIEDGGLLANDESWLDSVEGGDDAGGRFPWTRVGRPRWQRKLGDDLHGCSMLHATDARPSTVDDTLDEIVQLGLVALVPSADGWHLAPAIRRDESAPLLRAEINALVSFRHEIIRRSGGMVLDHHTDLDPAQKDRLFEEISADLDIERRCPTLRSLSNLGIQFEDRSLWSLADAVTDIGFLERSDVVPYLLFRETQPVRYECKLMKGRIAHLIEGDDLTVEEADRNARSDIVSMMRESGLPLTAEDAPNPEVESRVAASMVAAAQEMYDRFLLDAPELRFSVGSVVDWFDGRAPGWIAIGRNQGQVPLASLSEAQRRWALLAMALRDNSFRHVAVGDGVRLFAKRHLFVFLDEPDAALHATAERHAVRGLAQSARMVELAVVYLSTHSAEFLNHEDVKPWHVRRGAVGEVLVDPLDSVHRSKAKDLGVQPADLLMLSRCFLIVEGTHDQIVLDALIGDQLDELRALVLPMRGGRLLASVPDSYFLAHFSDTPVIAALDNLSATKVQGFWDEICSLSPGQDMDEVVKSHFTSKERSEEVFLIDYARAVTSLGQTQRFSVFAFQKPDIPEYLPVNVIVPGATSWEELRSAHSAQSKIRAFKPWLQKTHGVTVDEAILRRACDAMDSVPEDFVRLIEACRSAQRRMPQQLS
jgi:hypothetical protein